jgi:hypothetical protein
MCVLRPRQQRYVVSDAFIAMILLGLGTAPAVMPARRVDARGAESLDAVVAGTALLFALMSNASRGYFEPADPTSSSTSASTSSSALPKYKAAGIGTAATQLPVLASIDRFSNESRLVEIMTPPLRAYWAFRALLHVPGAKLVRRYDQLPFDMDAEALRGVTKLLGAADHDADAVATKRLSWTEFAVQQDGTSERAADGSACFRHDAAAADATADRAGLLGAALRHWRQFVGAEGNVAVIPDGGAGGDAVIVLSPGKVVAIRCEQAQAAPASALTEHAAVAHLLRVCCATSAIPLDRVVVELAVVSTHAPLSMEERVIDGHQFKFFTTQRVAGDAATKLETMER